MIAALAFALLTSEMPKLDISSPPFVSGYASLRNWAEIEPEKVPEPCRPSVAKFRALIERAGDAKPLGPVMTLLDGLAATCRKPEDFRKAVERLPDDWKRGSIDRAWMLAAGEVITEASATWNRSGDDTQVLARRKELEDSQVLPKAWDWLADKLGIQGAPKSIHIVLVPRFAAPGGITMRTSSSVVVLISAEIFFGTALLETVLHEGLHACEAEETKVDLLSRIRLSDALEKLDAADRRNLPHTVYFIAAAEAIRRGGAPQHKDVGITLGTYDRAYEKYRRYIEPFWQAYLKGEIDREKLAAEICSYKSGLKS